MKINLTADQIINLLNFCLILFGSIILFMELRFNLRFNQRKAAIDFIFTNISGELKHYEEELNNLIGKNILLLKPNETLNSLLKNKKYSAKTKKEIENTIKGILNFYERMAICIFKEAFDEDICYDDKGFVMIYFYQWVSSYIIELRRFHNDERIYVNFEALAQKWQHIYNKSVERISQRGLKSPNQKIIVNRPII